MKVLKLFILMFILNCPFIAGQTGTEKPKLYKADNPDIQYTGRIDFSNPEKPKFWASGVYIKAKFKGSFCKIIFTDEVLWGKEHNIFDVIIDERSPLRIRSFGKENSVVVAQNIPGNEHTITIVKDTEAKQGYTEFIGFVCDSLLPLPPKPERKIEFIGNSITCGFGNDQSGLKCGEGEWYDHHTADLSYGPLTARALNAQYHLSSYSGIGMVHSCCDLDMVISDVYENTDLNKGNNKWNFSKYVPDLVTVCLGQNDGVQDSVKFCDAYKKFIGTVRGHYPDAQIILLTSPMGDSLLTSTLKNYLSGIVTDLQKAGDNKVDRFSFCRQYISGCDYHPDLKEHRMIADELIPFLRNKMNW